MGFRAMLAGLGAVLMLGAIASPAQAADDYLVLSTPERHAELDRRPGWVTLVFASDAGASYAAIVVQSAAGENVTVGPPIVEGDNVTIQLVDGLPRGTYTVFYRTEDADGGPRGGAFQFAYGPGTWTDVDEVWIGEEEQPPEIDEPGPPPSSLEPEETPTAEPEPIPSETVTASPTETPVASPTPSETPGAELPGEPESNPTGWIVALGAGVAALIVGGIVVVTRRRGSGEPPRHVKDDSTDQG
ncbi:MAG: copper resistance protein CopC [Propionicimonas sp.]